jgi:hypothetical protein
MSTFLQDLGNSITGKSKQKFLTQQAELQAQTVQEYLEQQTKVKLDPGKISEQKTMIWVISITVGVIAIFLIWKLL